MPSAQQLLTPGPGWQKVYAHRYVSNWASVAQKHASVDSVTFRTASTFGVVLGRVKAKVAAFDQLQRAHHSQMYGLALYRRKTPVFRAVIPRKIGPIPIPGGGANIATVDEYRLIGVHSQVQIGWAVVVLILGLAILVVATTSSGRQAIGTISRSLSNVFGGGQITAATQGVKSIVWIYVGAGALVAVGTGALYLEYLRTSERVGGAPSPPPMLQAPQLPAVSGGLSTPYGGLSGGVGTVAPAVSVAPRTPRAPRPTARDQSRDRADAARARTAEAQARATELRLAQQQARIARAA